MSSAIVKDPELADPKSRKTAHCCPHCERLLREAYQTEEGVRVCKECLHEIKRYIYSSKAWGARGKLAGCIDHKVPLLCGLI